MEAAQADSHAVVGVEVVLPGRVQLHVVQEVNDSTGREAEDEDDEDEGAGPDIQRPVAAGAAQVVHDGAVRECDDGGGQHQPRANHAQSVGYEEGEGLLHIGQHIVAGGDAQAGQPVGLVHKQLRHHGHATRQPDGNRGQHGAAALGQGLVDEGPRYSQVSHDAHAHECQHRAVHVAIETGSDQTAGGFTKHPVVAMEMVVHT